MNTHCETVVSISSRRPLGEPRALTLIWEDRHGVRKSRAIGIPDAVAELAGRDLEARVRDIADRLLPNAAWHLVSYEVDGRPASAVVGTTIR